MSMIDKIYVLPTKGRKVPETIGLSRNRKGHAFEQAIGALFRAYQLVDIRTRTSGYLLDSGSYYM